MPRGVWEFLVLIFLGAVGYGAWWWLGIEHRGELQKQKDALVAEHAAAMAELEGQVRSSNAAEAMAAAVAFAAGIETLAASERWPAIDRAVLELLELPGVSFVHVLGAGGSVRVSSDRKFLATGRAGPRASWALGANGVIQRVSAGAVIEIAVPLDAAAGGAVSEGEETGARSILWLGYSRTGSSSVPASGASGPGASGPEASAPADPE
ncbi:MAG: hypothetical protein AAF725_02765 [Acidobacteriota bacterium]